MQGHSLDSDRNPGQERSGCRKPVTSDRGSSAAAATAPSEIPDIESALGADRLRPKKRAPIPKSLTEGYGTGLLLLFSAAILASLSPPSAGAADALPVPFIIDQTHSDPSRGTREPDRTYRGPLIDTHAHLSAPHGHRSTDVNEVLVGIDKAGIDAVVVMPTPNEGRGSAAGQRQKDTLRQAAGGRAVVLCGSDYLTQWMSFAAIAGQIPTDVDAQMARLAADLQGGGCAGVGEIALRHYDKTGKQPVIDLPAGYPPLLAIADTAARAGAWLDLHAEPADRLGHSHAGEVFGTIALMFQRSPNLHLILSHTGMTNAHNARALLTTFPNLMMNIKPIRDSKEDEWEELEPVNRGNGFYEDWAGLFEEMPDRFMIGTDFKFGHNGARVEKYERQVRLARRLLGELRPEAARQIAYSNAERVFRIAAH